MKSIAGLLLVALTLGSLTLGALADVAVLSDADGDGYADALSRSPVDGGSGIGASEPDALGVSWNGNAYNLDSSDCTGNLLGPTGATTMNGSARDGSGKIYIAGRGGGLWTVDPENGQATKVASIGLRDVRALALSRDGALYMIEEGAPDTLYSVDPESGQAEKIGPTGLRSIQGMASDADGTLYGWDLQLGLVTINKDNGEATDVNGDVGGRDMQALTFAPDGTLYGGRHELYVLDTDTGEFELCGSGGFSDVRGFDLLEGGGGGQCNYKIVKSKAKGGCESCPSKGDAFKSQAKCEKAKDCRKKIKTTISCPDGEGKCKIKAKKRKCE